MEVGEMVGEHTSVYFSKNPEACPPDSRPAYLPTIYLPTFVLTCHRVRGGPLKSHGDVIATWIAYI